MLYGLVASVRQKRQALVMRFERLPGEFRPLTVALIFVTTAEGLWLAGMWFNHHVHEPFRSDHVAALRHWRSLDKQRSEMEQKVTDAQTEHKKARVALKQSISKITNAYVQKAQLYYDGNGPVLDAHWEGYGEIPKIALDKELSTLLEVYQALPSPEPISADGAPAVSANHARPERHLEPYSLWPQNCSGGQPMV